VRGRSPQRSGKRHPLDARVAGAQQLVGSILDPPGDVGVCRLSMAKTRSRQLNTKVPDPAGRIMAAIEVRLTLFPSS